MTPIERAVEELVRLDLCLPSRDRLWAARAVLESIDVDELARVITASLRGRRWADLTPLDIANTVRAYLLTGDESDE